MIKQYFSLTALLFLFSYLCWGSSKDQVMVIADNVGFYLKGTVRPLYRDERVRLFVRNGNAEQALDMLARGQTDIAALTRPLNGYEKLRNPQFEEIPVASDALVFIVHPDNPIENLSFRDIQKIYNKPGVKWGEFIGPGHELSDQEIIPISKTQNNGVFQAFMRYFRFAGVTQEASGLYFQRYPNQDDSVRVIMASRDEVAMARLAVYRNGIAFVSLGALNSPKVGKNFKAVNFNRVEPSFKSVFHRQYPLTYRLNFVVDTDNLSRSTQDYIDWVLDGAGQDIFRAAGLAPINLKTRIIRTNTSLTHFRRY